MNHHHDRKHIIGISLAAISSLTFGLAPYFSVVLMNEGYPAIEVLAYRWGVGTLVLMIFALLAGNSFRLPKKAILPTLFVSVFRALTSITLLLSFQNITSGASSTIHFMYPLIVAAIMMLFFHEKKSWIKIGAILFSIVGAILLSSGGIRLEGGDLTRGLVYSILSVVTYAIYIIGLRNKRLDEVESTPLTCYVMGFAAICFIITGQFTGGITWIPFSEKTTWLHILGIAIPATAISNITLIKSVKLVGATLSSILGILEPITAVLIGIWAFAEPFTIKTAIGLAIIIIAACVVILNHRIEQKLHSANNS